MARYLVGSLVVLALAACGKMWVAERDAWRHEAEVACLKSGLVKEGPALVRIEPISGPGICGADFPLKVAAIGEGAPVGYTDELRPPSGIPGQPLANAPASPNYTPSPTYQSYPQQTYEAQPQYPPPPQQYPSQYPPPSQYPAPQQYPPSQAAYPQANGPMAIHPPGTEPPDAEDDVEEQQQSYPPQVYPRQSVPQQAYPQHQPYPQQAYPQQQYPQQGYGAPPNAPPTRPPISQSYPPAEPVPLGTPRAPVTTGSVAVQPAATLACPIVSSLDTWFTQDVQPAAMKWFGAPVAEIRQISAYSCRGMNGQRGAPISEHAFGNALDIAAFTLSDGRKVTVKDGWRGLPEEQGFLRDVQAAACRHFSTVLAPGSNAFHYDHIHVDLMRRASGRQICNPAAVSGELVAARAGYRIGARGDASITGSIRKTERAVSLRTLRGRDEVYDGLPRAVPGED